MIILCDTIKNNFVENSYSAVSMLGGNSGYSVSNNIKGVIRFVQTIEGCIIDGTVDGLEPGQHGIHVHECGDISKGCERYYRVFYFTNIK